MILFQTFIQFPLLNARRLQRNVAIFLTGNVFVLIFLTTRLEFSAFTFKLVF